jgi:hypothetical protein
MDRYAARDMCVCLLVSLLSVFSKCSLNKCNAFQSSQITVAAISLMHTKIMMYLVEVDTHKG